MAYKAPALDELIHLAETLNQTYTGTNKKRLALIERYKHLASQASKAPSDVIANQMIGALVFIMDDIKFHEYTSGRDPEVKFFFGSCLYTEIKKGLKITKQNDFGYDERLFYINEYHKMMNSSYSEEQWLDYNKNFPHLIWETKKECIDDIEKVLNKIFALNNDKLEGLIHGVPILQPLLNNLQQLEQEYLKVNPIIKNKKRRATLNCVNFLLKSYEGMNPTAQSWHAGVGSAMVAMMQIKDEYHILSPEGGFLNKGSKLYQECSEAINKELKNITPSQKILCIQNLSSYLTTLFNDRSYYQSVLNQMFNAMHGWNLYLMSTPKEDDYQNYKTLDENNLYLYQEDDGKVFYYTKETQEKYYLKNDKEEFLNFPENALFDSTNENMKKYVNEKIETESFIMTSKYNHSPVYQGKKITLEDKQNELNELDQQIHHFRNLCDYYLKQLYEKSSSLSFLQRMVSTGMYYATTSAFGSFIFSVSRSLIANTLKIGGCVVTGSVGTALFSLSGVGTILLATGLTRLLKQGLVEAISASLCVWLLDKIGSTVASTTLAIADFSYSTTPEGFMDMRKKLKPDDDIAFVHFVNTLLELPQVKEEEKNQIRFVLGLKENEKCRPLIVRDVKNKYESHYNMDGIHKYQSSGMRMVI